MNLSIAVCLLCLYGRRGNANSRMSGWWLRAHYLCGFGLITFVVCGVFVLWSARSLFCRLRGIHFAVCEGIILPYVSVRHQRTFYKDETRDSSHVSKDTLHIIIYRRNKKLSTSTEEVDSLTLQR